MAQILTPESVLGQNEQFLIYGEPKTGKTELALSAPGPIYVLCIGPENELKTRYSKHFMERPDGGPDKIVYFDSARETRGKHGEITDNPTGFDEACTHLDQMLHDVQTGKMEKPETIIVDNATVLEEYQMNKAMIAGYDLAGNKEKTALKRMRDYGIIKPGDSDWGAAQSLMSKMVSWLFALPYNLVMVAHEYKEFESKGENSRDRQISGIYPLFVGQQRIQITRAFDNVWRTTTAGGGRTTQYWTQTTGDERVVAGTRVGGVLQEKEQNLSLTNVIEAFKKYPQTLADRKSGTKEAVARVRG